jgi:hypothetical protein
MDSETMQYLTDRAEIHELLMRYPRAVDQVKPEMMRSVFTEDGFLAGSLGYETRGIEDIVQMVGRIDRYDTTFHFMGNVHIEVRGNSATTEVYCTAYHFWDVAGERQEYIMGIRYVDDLVRTADGWRVKERYLNVDWEKGTRLP